MGRIFVFNGGGGLPKAWGKVSQIETIKGGALRVYLSSTLSDLEPERTTIKKALSGECIVIESYEADPRPLWQSCVADVESCELYICVVGLRYGFIPPGQPKSITELEFDAAVGTGIPCLVFMKTSSSITVDKSDGGTGEHPQKLILDFRARVSSGGDGFSRPANFSTLSELTERVLKALLRLRAQPDPRLVSTDGNMAAAGVVRLATPPVSPAAVRPDSSASLSGQTELQGMLWRFLNEHWPGVLPVGAGGIACCRQLPGLPTYISVDTDEPHDRRAPCRPHLPPGSPALATGVSTGVRLRLGRRCLRVVDRRADRWPGAALPLDRAGRVCDGLVGGRGGTHR